jgi:hypothetical protein
MMTKNYFNDNDDVVASKKKAESLLDGSQKVFIFWMATLLLAGIVLIIGGTMVVGQRQVPEVHDGSIQSPSLLEAGPSQPYEGARDEQRQGGVYECGRRKHRRSRRGRGSTKKGKEARGQGPHHMPQMRKTGPLCERMS